MPQIGLALGNLVGVMREDIVHAAAVDVHVLAQMLHGDAGALDVPAGIPQPPGALPLQLLILELGLGEPQHEIRLVPLVPILVHIVPHAHQQLLLAVVGEHIILFQFGGVKVDVPAALIGEALLQEPLYHVDELRNAVGGRLHHVRCLDVQVCAVGEKSVRVELRNLHHRLVLPLRALEHLVLAGVRVAGQMSHVRDVHDPLHVVADIP